MLYLIGLGPFGLEHVPRGAEGLLSQCKRVFLETYTAALLGADLIKVEELFGVHVEHLTREEVEAQRILLDAAAEEDAALLVVGDPLSATTHQALRVEAMRRGIGVRVLFAPSVMTVVPGLLGLSHYRFGRTTTAVIPRPGFRPTSYVDVVERNLRMDLHTLVLLDIHEDGRCLLAPEAVEEILRVAEARPSSPISSKSLVCAVARACAPDQVLFAGTAEELIYRDLGGPMHSLVFPARLHFAEAEALQVLAGCPSELVHRC